MIREQKVSFHAFIRSVDSIVAPFPSPSVLHFPFFLLFFFFILRINVSSRNKSNFNLQKNFSFKDYIQRYSSLSLSIRIIA